MFGNDMCSLIEFVYRRNATLVGEVCDVGPIMNFYSLCWYTNSLL